jgi:hypothetical protein
MTSQDQVRKHRHAYDQLDLLAADPDHAPHVQLEHPKMLQGQLQVGESILLIVHDEPQPNHKRDNQKKERVDCLYIYRIANEERQVVAGRSVIVLDASIHD